MELALSALERALRCSPAEVVVAAAAAGLAGWVWGGGGGKEEAPTAWAGAFS